MTTFLPVIPVDGDDWLDRAACADLTIDAFFVQAGHVIDEDVLNTCRRCPVRIECITHAYNPALNITGGYFAGMSPGQRREMSLAEAVEYCNSDTVDRPKKAAAMVEDPLLANIEDDGDDEPIVYS